jgi:hypothetical protein
LIASGLTRSLIPAPIALSIQQKGGLTMSTWLSQREQRLVAGAEAASAATPIPTQIV